MPTATAVVSNVDVALSSSFCFSPVTLSVDYPAQQIRFSFSSCDSALMLFDQRPVQSAFQRSFSMTDMYRSRFREQPFEPKFHYFSEQYCLSLNHIVESLTNISNSIFFVFVAHSAFLSIP
ncbi:unnamed protein product [Nippostrongylus brasiliensis]|uniref:Secreted protein n=1 Tax=Nippostrongylus brasiliensis TaxID=27835 RepID=A0A0N4XVK1_NIPBR|nr:unnamed protein product [Nippostrongylus brasiliensis]